MLLICTLVSSCFEAEEPVCKWFVPATVSQRCRLDADALPTLKVTATFLIALQDYAKQKGKERVDFETVSSETLADLVERFYIDAINIMLKPTDETVS